MCEWEGVCNCKHESVNGRYVCVSMCECECEKECVCVSGSGVCEQESWKVGGCV